MNAHASLAALLMRTGLLAAAWLCAAAARGQTNPLPPGLVMHLSFDDSPGGVYPDKSGRGHGGQLRNVNWTQSGRLSGGAEIGVSNSYVLVTNRPSLALDQATFTVWVRTLRSEAYPRLLLDKRPERGFGLGLTGGPEPGRGRAFFTVGGTTCRGDAPLTDGSWHHVAAVAEGATLRLVIDNQPQREVVPRPGGIPVNDTDLAIGMNRSTTNAAEKGKSLGGTLDDLMIFNRALATNEIAAVLAAGRPRFTKQQVERRLAELKDLLDRGLILPDFYARKVKECEVFP
jgi:hypothetical protein